MRLTTLTISTTEIDPDGEVLPVTTSTTHTFSSMCREQRRDHFETAMVFTKAGHPIPKVDAARWVAREYFCTLEDGDYFSEDHCVGWAMSTPVVFHPKRAVVVDIPTRLRQALTPRFLLDAAEFEELIRTLATIAEAVPLVGWEPSNHSYTPDQAGIRAEYRKAAQAMGELGIITVPDSLEADAHTRTPRFKEV